MKSEHFDLNYTVPINDLFANFAINWSTLMPALVVLFGTLTAFFIIKLVMRLNS